MLLRVDFEIAAGSPAEAVEIRPNKTSAQLAINTFFITGVLIKGNRWGFKRPSGIAFAKPQGSDYRA
jgi:hypothetical protein